MNAIAEPIIETPAQADFVAQRRGYWSTVFSRLARDPVTIVCALIVLCILLAAIFAPYVAPHDPYKTSMLKRLAPVGTPGYVLGTDELGRDMLSRLIHGGRVSMFTAIAPVLAALLLGGSLGVIAGFVGGRTNMVIMRTMDVFYAFPSILLAIAISGALGAGIVNAVISLTLIFMPPICRVAETVTTQVRELDFVAAARATPASTLRILRVHVLGNVLGPVLIYASSLVSVSIIIASGLSFLGLGVSPPAADWGLMLNTLRQSIYVAPLNAAMPGVMIFITGICFNLMSDGLRSAMDVKL
ncbi:MAG: ABC transporter permease [Gammaproteobacteria bacterium]|nr:ABC transporter permease [Gammaproteobacteria bacterium]